MRTGRIPRTVLFRGQSMTCVDIARVTDVPIRTVYCLAKGRENVTGVVGRYERMRRERDETRAAHGVTSLTSAMRQKLYRQREKTREAAKIERASRFPTPQ